MEPEMEPGSKQTWKEGYFMKKKKKKKPLPSFINQCLFPWEFQSLRTQQELMGRKILNGDNLPVTKASNKNKTKLNPNLFPNWVGRAHPGFSWALFTKRATVLHRWFVWRWCSGKEPAWQCSRQRFHPWVWKMPWRRKWQPTPVFLPGKSHGLRSLVGYSPWGCKESDMTEQLHFTPLHF